MSAACILPVLDTQDHTSAPQHRSIHLPTCLREAWSSTTPTHASFYFCTAPERPAMMLVMLASIFPRQLPSRSPPCSLPSPVPTHVPPVSLPSPTHAPPVSLPSIYSLPNPVSTRAPPVSLPSMFPPQPRSHPRASVSLPVPTHAPLVSLPSIYSLPNPVPTRAPPVSLPSLPSPPFLPLPSFPSLFLPFPLPFPTPSPSTSTSIFRPRQRKSLSALATKREPKHRRCFWEKTNLQSEIKMCFTKQKEKSVLHFSRIQTGYEFTKMVTLQAENRWYPNALNLNPKG